jgi:hypothetical protein
MGKGASGRRVIVTGIKADEDSRGAFGIFSGKFSEDFSRN